MARKQIILTSDTVAQMVSKLNTLSVHTGDLDGLDAAVPVDSDVVQVLNALYDSIGAYSLGLSTTAQTLKGAINEHETDIGNMTLTGLTATDISAAIRELRTELGDHTTLTTTAQTDVVAAINEINAELYNSPDGSGADFTTDATTIEGAINEMDARLDSSGGAINVIHARLDSNQPKIITIDSQQSYILQALGFPLGSFGTYTSGTDTYSGDLSGLDVNINVKTSLKAAVNDIQSQVTGINTSLGITDGNVGSISDLQDPIERTTIVAAINSLRDSVVARRDSAEIGGLTLDENRIGTNTGSLTLHDGFGPAAGTTFAKFEKYQDSDLIISGGDAGSSSIIISDSSVTVVGNFSVQGTTTYVKTETVQVDDNIIELNTNYTGATPTENGGVLINRGSHAAGDAIVQWNEVDSNWELGTATDLRKVVRYNDTDVVTTAMVANDAITYAKMENAAANTLVARPTNSAGDLSELAVAASRVVGRTAAGNLDDIQIDNSHIAAAAAIANTKLANSSVTVNGQEISLGGSGTIDIAGGIDSLGAVTGITTAGVGGNASPIALYASDDSSQTIIMGFHPDMYNPTNNNLPARSVLIGWHAGSTPDQAADNDGTLYSTHIGYRSGKNNDAQYNTSVGAEALGGGSLTTGDGNVAIGYNALNEVSSSANNVGVGREAGDQLTTGHSNIAIGYQSGPANAGGTAAQNTFLGHSAGRDGTTGANNTLLGHNAQKSAATASNEMTFGDANVTKWRFPGVSLEATTKTFIYASDGTTVLRSFLTGSS